ncbi:MAG: hypothetical protein AAGK09_01850 [Planctomycetota bacterium]
MSRLLSIALVASGLCFAGGLALGARPLVTDGALTPQEKAHFIEWAVKAKSPADNWENHWVLRYFYVDVMYWVYIMSDHDPRILANLMVMADKAVDRNNKRDVRRLIHVGWDDQTNKPIGEVLPSWPHSQDFGEDIDGNLVNEGDAGEVTVGAIFMCVAARAIVETPEVWDQTVPGKDYTYLERARYYIDESIDAVERSFKRLYVDPETLEQQYQVDFPPPPLGRGWRGRGVFVPFNRVWHAQTLFTYLNPCLEQLGLHPDKVAEYDRITEVAMDTWINESMRRYSESGRKLLDYPYRFDPDEETNSEDVGHSAYDVFEIGAVYRSGRYPIVTNDILERWANTIVYKVHQGDGTYAYRLSGEGKPKPENQPRQAYYQFKRFHPDLADHVKPPRHGWSSTLYFARAFAEIQVDCVVDDGPTRTTKSIAVTPGSSLKLTASFPEDDRYWSWVGPNGFEADGASIEFGAVDREHHGTYAVSHAPPDGVERTTYLKVTVYDPDVLANRGAN